MNVLSICTTHLNIHNSSTRSHSSEEENSVSMQAFSNLVNVSILVNLLLDDINVHISPSTHVFLLKNLKP